MLMLQIVIRPSIDSASMALPVLDDVTLSATGADLRDHREDDVLRTDSRGSWPSTFTAMVLNGRSGNVCVASTCSTSDVPMPIASEPNAPWVDV